MVGGRHSDTGEEGQKVMRRASRHNSRHNSRRERASRMCGKGRPGHRPARNGLCLSPGSLIQQRARGAAPHENIGANRIN
jgi:hypothetical protein